ncbi:MAG: hypothetical protein PHT99_04615 [Methanoregula sp.]|nr:hypothetical protein [Methanoregula sp.]
MSPDRKTSASVPAWIALLCIVIICGVLVGTSLQAAPDTVPGQPAPQPSLASGLPDAAMSPTLALPRVCPADVRVTPTGPPVTETVAGATLVLNRPVADDRVPYRERDFSDPSTSLNFPP